MNPVIDAMMAHRSIRRYTEEPVSDESIRTAVAAGQAASTSSAVQSYCVVRVRDEAARSELADLSGPQSKVATSAVFLVVCGDVRRHRLVCDRAGQPYQAQVEAFLLATIDATLFAQNLVLAFESMGLGICYIGGLRNDLARVDAVLGLPDGVYPLYGLCVGRPAEEPAARPRLPLDAVLMEDHYLDDDQMLEHLDDYDEIYRAYLKERGAEPRTWTTSMARKFARPERTDLGSYYRGKGAVFT